MARPKSPPASPKTGVRTLRASKAPVAPLAPKRPSTKALLMDAAEVLVGRQGLDGATLREIALMAGQANSTVVQYHFRDKIGLIEATLDDRSDRLETLRAEKFAALKAAGKQRNPRELLAILLLPSLSLSESFCQFLLHCMLHPELMKRRPHQQRFAGSVVVEIVKLLREAHKDLPLRVFNDRLTVISLMFLASAVEADNARRYVGASQTFDTSRILAMAVAALAAPDE